MLRKKIFFCIDGYKINEAEDFKDFLKDSSGLKNRSISIKNQTIEKNENKDEEFEENFYPELQKVSIGLDMIEYD